MREIVLDTETTGLDPMNGDRVVEIGCVELVNRFLTGRSFHCYINPERDMPAEAFAVHGLSAEFLKGHGVFADICEGFVDFIEDAPLVIHNAGFDAGFLNAELERCGRPRILRERLVDTLLIARRKHPNGPNRLDDLCGRYGIDNSRRTKHGALLDAEILAEVYLELIGARQAQLGLAAAASATPQAQVPGGGIRVAARPVPLPARLTAADITEHAGFVATLGAEPLWQRYAEAQGEAAGTAARAGP